MGWNSLLKVYGRPTPFDAREGSSGIFQVVLALEKYLPEFGYRLVNDEASADLLAFHAGSGEGRTHVAHCHGLYPTALIPNAPEWMFDVNRNVIDDLRAAYAVTVPSEWIADILRRDMHFNPNVIHWGVDLDLWRGDVHGEYVLWNKNRVSDVCDPQWVNRLAKHFYKYQFVSTFGDELPNMSQVGVIPHAEMVNLVKSAKVYLATTKETGDIGTREALAAGVPVLGFAQGALLDIVQHGVNGFLAEPGDFEGLCDGLEYVMQHWRVLHQNAIHLSRDYSWRNTVQKIASVYDDVISELRLEALPHYPKVSVIVPCFNYADYVGDAIHSVMDQQTTFPFEVIAIDDASSDNSAAVLSTLASEYKNLRTFSHVENEGVANVRNLGIEIARGKYIVCLDADDQLAPGFLQLCADALDRDPTAGIVYTRIQVMGQGVSQWPDEFDYPSQLARRNQIPTCCMFHKKWWERGGGFRQNKHPAEDADLWLRMTSAGAKPIFLPKPLFIYRMHENSASAPVRRMEIGEPDWIGGKAWIKSHQIPFAAPIKRGSYPVRNYDRPFVSIIIPIGPGHEREVLNAFDSIEGQGISEWEIIAVNDTGHDLDGLDRAYVRWVSTGSTKGAGAARNAGLEKASAPLVVFLDADDFLMPDFLSATIKRYNQTGDYIYTDWFSIREDGSFLQHQTPEFSAGKIYMEGAFHAVTCLIEKKAVEAIGGFDENLPSWEDTEFYMRLIANGTCGQRVGAPLVAYRITTGGRRDQGASMQQVLKSELARRFPKYVNGEEIPVCNCKAKSSPGEWAATDLIEIRYNGPIGNHHVIGPVTKTNYGVREGGQQFMVFAPDAQAMPDKFSPITQIIEEPKKTDIPPAPEEL